MSDLAIRADNIGKLYHIGTLARRNDTLRDTLVDFGNQVTSHMKRSSTVRQSQAENEVWALRDVSFEVRQGQVLGVIGKNGAGKSTLLKVLSRVTEPTTGSIEIRGRVGSLLEVGTGFHPELTGRENIYLNGAILGMSGDEVKRKFDQIVDFSGVEQFIDTPVKRYSSGMYVRLAFAVAAHLDPDILVVDEVLAVGDADFQKKCLGKMGDVVHAGRTILFVSHNMGMIHSLCSRGILLQQGKLFFDGNTASAIAQYYSNGLNTPYSIDYSKSVPPVGDQYATLLSAHIEDDAGSISGEVDLNTGFKVKMRYQLHHATPRSPYPNFHFYNSQGQCVFITAGDRMAHVSGDAVYEAACSIPGNFLNNDTYFIGIALVFTHNGIRLSFFEQGALSVIVRDPMDLDNTRQGYSGPVPGLLRPRLDWEVRIIS